MGKFVRAILDHPRKSRQVQSLKKKLKRRVSVDKLIELRNQELKWSANPMDYYYSDGNDDFVRDLARHNARIELYNELIKSKTN